MLPIDVTLVAIPTDSSKMTKNQFAEETRKQAIEARELVKQHRPKIQQKQKERYDKAHRYGKYEPNDLVLVYKSYRKIRLSEKLLHRFMGPFIVVRQTAPSNYLVKRQGEKA